MSYSTDNLSDAGKITVLTAFLGVIIFVGVFLLNVGGHQFKEVSAASTATTSVTVVNTPPVWTQNAGEEFESSTSSPTDAGQQVSWTAIGTDPNGERYYLLICSTVATPTANANAAPACDTPSHQWGVSASTTSGVLARAATTTLASFAESNAWFGWVCDSNPTSPRCSTTYTQGSNATSSPFEVNHRPVFTAYTNTSPGIPGASITFYSTSSDSDVSGIADQVKLIVCNANDYSTTTDLCGAGGTLASSTFFAANASTTYTIVIPTQDQNYTAYGYVVDNHNFEASGGAQGTSATLTVSNVAPTVTPALININGGSDMTLTVAANQTPGFTLQFTVIDNNSCQAVGSTSEITGYIASVYRSGIGDAVCDGSAGAYNANNCYPSGVATSTWNLNCTLDVSSCSGPLDTSAVYNCTFPLWYIADPTDGTATSTQYPTQNWLASVQAADNNFATGTKASSTNPVEVRSFLAFALNTLTIPYGSLQPGSQTDPIVSTTTLASTGNVGIDQNLAGESMCPTYGSATHCPNSATSTIDANEQVYGTSTVAYAGGVALSSTTPTFLNLKGPKSTSTSTPATKNAYWGIKVPSAITYAGNYTGENTFYAVSGAAANW